MLPLTAFHLDFQWKALYNKNALPESVKPKASYNENNRFMLNRSQVELPKSTWLLLFQELFHFDYTRCFSRHILQYQGQNSKRNSGGLLMSGTLFLPDVQFDIAKSYSMVKIYCILLSLPVITTRFS